jgi:hypothetical protein
MTLDTYGHLFQEASVKETLRLQRGVDAILAEAAKAEAGGGRNKPRFLGRGPAWPPRGANLGTGRRGFGWPKPNEWSQPGRVGSLVFQSPGCSKIVGSHLPIVVCLVVNSQFVPLSNILFGEEPKFIVGLDIWVLRVIKIPGNSHRVKVLGTAITAPVLSYHTEIVIEFSYIDWQWIKLAGI